MNSYNTIYNGEKIIAPLSAFNNFIIDLGKELSDIFDYDMYGTNSVIFDNKGFMVFAKVKFFLNKTQSEMNYQFINPISIEDNWLVSTITSKFKEIEYVLMHYLFIINDITKNYDDKITHKYIESIITSRKKNKMFLIPFKNKIFNEIDNDETLLNIYSKFSYVLNIIDVSKNEYSCSIIRVVSSDLDESNSLENIRFLDKEIINTQVLNKRDLKPYLIKLMFYGEF